ncbi:MAG: hypothetical protein PHH20_01280 [Candidatus Omnitrophica bacterium]|nr:hypothetical protein [Candidatus Omnitrophota bacterium]
MKKLMFAVMGIMLFSATAFSYDINDDIGDQIGVPDFDIHGIDYNLSASAISFDIYENYSQAGLTVGSWNTFSGDLFIDLTGDYVWDVGVPLTGHDDLSAGSLYSLSGWQTSNYYAPSGGYIYNKNIPVTIIPDEFLLAGSVAWNTFGTGIGDSPLYKVSINIPLPSELPFDIGEIPVLDKQHVLFTSATCANDYVGAPEPVSTALFVLGGTVLLARRMRKAKK